ncbi:CPBP family intramembrane glutamic endopeptidase [Coraliomargarita parva]|uniref:CPBP family intramembrane glutamic endopeptidase n=1 Tax=Coraliomargarita parva TaxID=3014050 RepID=UPI0022B2C6C8|nr:CPBP family intramembrane glutamic endopeptidase [Coraliomargarita parva]
MQALNENPLMILLYVGIAAYVLFMYWGDSKAARMGQASPKAMPGAQPLDWNVSLIGVIGAWIILANETAGELVFGVSQEQSDMIWYYVFATLAAGVVEEVIFRGFLVIENKGRAALIASCVGFSLIFALIHGHFWDTEEGFQWTFTVKAWFTTGILFINSLWFYALRFGPWNKNRSIFPSMIAHAASNFGVFAVKLWQGHVIF